MALSASLAIRRTPPAMALLSPGWRGMAIVTLRRAANQAPGGQ